MAELTQSVSGEKVSMIWEEEYVSRGFNKQQSIVPPGLYEGGLVDYSDVSTLRIAAGNYVVQDDTNGFGLTLNDSDITEIDCSSLFPAASETDWYIGLRIVYTTGVATTAEFFMTDVVPADKNFIGKGELVFCKVTIHSADTGLDMATFEQLDAAKPTPYPVREDSGSVTSDDRHLGLIDNVTAYRIPSVDEKQGLAGYPSAPSNANKVVTQAYLGSDASVSKSQSVTISDNVKFQITGSVYVGDGSTSSTVRPWIRLLANPGDNSPYALADGNLVEVDKMRTSDDLTDLVPSTHADADGFYDSPWVYLTVDTGTILNETITCVFSSKVTVDDIPGLLSSIALASANIDGHAASSNVRSAGTPGSAPYDRWTISAGSLQVALEQILTAVNQTQFDNRALSTDWYEIFRSGTNNDPSSATLGNTSIYVRGGQYAMLVGALLNSSDEIIGTGGNVSVLILGGARGAVFASKPLSFPVPGTNYGLIDDIDGKRVSPFWREVVFGGTNLTDITPFELSNGLRLNTSASGASNRGISIEDPVLLRGLSSTDSGVFIELANPERELAFLLVNARYDKTYEWLSVRDGDYGFSGLKLKPLISGDNEGTMMSVHHNDGDGGTVQYDGWNAFAGMFKTDSSPAATVFADGGDLAIDNDASAGLVEVDGLLIVKCVADSKIAVFVIDSMTNTTTLLHGDTAYWATTGTTSNRVNVYFSGSNLVIYNYSTGGSKTFRVGGFDVNQYIDVPAP